MNQPPYCLFEVNNERPVEKIQGFIGDLWHGILEQSLNFSTQISLPPDGAWVPLGKMEIGPDSLVGFWKIDPKPFWHLCM